MQMDMCASTSAYTCIYTYILNICHTHTHSLLHMLRDAGIMHLVHLGTVTSAKMDWVFGAREGASNTHFIALL